MSFADLGLKPELLRAVDEKGYSVPTPIQAKAIPAVLAGGDVLAGAQTGTGKTAAFVLPILQKLGQAGGRAPRALVLTPTRELAAQVAESARSYGRYVGIRTVVVFGGVSINPQIDALYAGCDLLVATPGRLLDLAEQGALDLRSVECFVLDEADRMLDMGFIPAIRRVVKLLPAQRQNLMFSATYSDDIRQLAGRILRNPASIEVAARNATAERVDQQVYRVPKDHKRHLLAHLIDDGNWHQVLVFTRTKHGANRLAQQLESSGIRSAAIHGNKSQGARVRALSDFKANKVTALVATEVAARGLDIKELPHVVNYELPNVPEDYVHRIGRTARAGGSGSAVSLVSPDETPLLKDIERMLKRTLPVTALPEFQIIAAPAGAPRTEDRASERRGGGGGRHSARYAGGGGRSGRHGNGGGDRGRPAHAGQGHAGHAGHAGRGGGGNSGGVSHQHGGSEGGSPQHVGNRGDGNGVSQQHGGNGQGVPAQHADHSAHRGDGGTRGRSDPQRHNHGGGGQSRPGQPSRRFSSGGGGGGQRHRAGGGRSTGRR
ncbi:MAG: rhlE1 [Gammaproteobacteria bacterium]|nr:rhlE1 [Gammaproteobacteria bacterium]